MKGQINLKKLWRLNVVQIVEPSENLKDAYLKKSESSLLSSNILLKEKQLEDSISMVYYSMYNSVLALLYKCGIKSENHNASIFILNELFEIDTSLIEKAKKERKEAQYYTNLNIGKEDVNDIIYSAEEFNSVIKNFIDRLSSGDIGKYRTKFKEMLN